MLELVPRIGELWKSRRDDVLSSEDAGEFSIEMHRCPSKGLILRIPQIEPYPDYCGCCDVLYRRVLEPLGYDVRLDFTHVDEARCSLSVRAKRERTPVSPPRPG